MTLKEKFEPFAFCNLGNNSMERQYQREDNAKECEQIADDYAIEFLEWCELKMVFNPSVIHKPTYKKLLEAFKKEKQL